MKYLYKFLKLKFNLIKQTSIKIIVGVSLLLMGNIGFGQVELEFAALIGGSSLPTEGKSIAIDDAGNIYTTGNFYNTIDIDPKIGVYNLTSIGVRDAFIQKLDNNGNFLWAKNIGQSGLSCEGKTIIIDSDGNVYVLGEYISRSFFIQKLDANGILIWEKSINLTGNSSSNSIALDNFGNIYITGQATHYTSMPIDFDPDLGIANLNITSPNIGYAFIQKLDINGNFLWVKGMQSTKMVSSKSIAIDNLGNIYTTGFFTGTADFDPSTNIVNLTALGNSAQYHHDLFIQKLDAAGNFVWVKRCGVYNSRASGRSIRLDKNGSIYIMGSFWGAIDFDPNAGISTIAGDGFFVQKIDENGSLIWVKGIIGDIYCHNLEIDNIGNIYTTGRFTGGVDFNPNSNTTNLTSSNINNVNNSNIFIQKLNSNGDLVWAKKIRGRSITGYSLTIDSLGYVYAIGHFWGNFNPPDFVSTDTSTNEDAFILKLSQNKVLGFVYNDFNQNCSRDSIEIGLTNRNFIITPGNIITNSTDGYWGINSLPVGTYSVTIDTHGTWSPTCPVTQYFTVTNLDSTTIAPSFGLYSTAPCPTPDISINSPSLRPGFSNQKVYVKACNQSIGSGALNNGYVIVELDPLLTVQSGSLPYTSIGNNQYRIEVDTIYPGFCAEFWLGCHLSTNAVLGQSLCMTAILLPVDSCSLDNTPEPSPPNISPCTTAFDGSFLSIQTLCQNDSIYFTIRNDGDGGMSCYSQIRIYIDGQLFTIDSILLNSGGSTTFAFAGDGRTWRLEVDQHPLLNGNSHPSATIEACGNINNWTPNLVNTLPQDDLDAHVDIFCGVVRGSYDPNDKTGYPLGLNASHDIVPNQELEYVIRFQNTGTDTAFTVVIRDTLSMDFNIFSVRSGVSSHPYSFKMYGPRVLEWTFNNIMLPDSNVNEIGSHGFVVFKVNQVENLPIGTILENSASIYFDFNAPIFTNTYFHTIDTQSHYISWDGLETITDTACNEFISHGFSYTKSGTYWIPIHKNGLDSLYTLDLLIHNLHTIIAQDSRTLNITNPDTTLSYQWLDCNNGNTAIPNATSTSYTPISDGYYAVQITKEDCIDTTDCFYFKHPYPQNDLGVFVYPNPITDKVNIVKGHNEKLLVRIFDNLGKLLIFRETQDAVLELDLYNFPAGIYYIHLCNGDKMAVQKIIRH